MPRAVFVPVGLNRCNPEKVLGAKGYTHCNVALQQRHIDDVFRFHVAGGQILLIARGYRARNGIGLECRLNPAVPAFMVNKDDAGKFCMAFVEHIIRNEAAGIKHGEIRLRHSCLLNQLPQHSQNHVR